MRPILIMQGDTRYAFAAGRIRSLELRLLNKAGVTKLLEANLEDFPRILAEFGYSFPSDIRSASDLEQLLTNEMWNLIKLMENLSVDKNFPRLIRVRYDFLSAAFLLKEKAGGKIAELPPWGTISIQELRRIFEEERWDKLPEELAQGIKLAQKSFAESGSPSSIDSSLEGKYLVYLKQKLPNIPFIHSYYELYFDLVNVINFVRSKVWDKGLRFFATLYIDGGSFGFDFYKSIFELPHEQLPARFIATEFGRPLGDAIQSALQQNNFAPLQEFKDKSLLEYLSGAKYCPFGLELLFAYYIRKERELGVLRAIARGKIFGIPQEIIKKALPYGYA